MRALQRRRAAAGEPSPDRRVFARKLAGFTLLEVTLAAALATMLIGAASFTLWRTMGHRRTVENVQRIEGLLIRLRSEAALQGRRVQLTFDAETARPTAAVELNPLTEPGVLTPLEAWWIERTQLTGEVRLAECRRTGDSALEDLAAALSPDANEESPYSPINFYPNGTSDSARIVLTIDDEEHPWAAEIVLNGMDGTVSTREINLEEEPLEQP